MFLVCTKFLVRTKRLKKTKKLKILNLSKKKISFVFTFLKKKNFPKK